jgi:hypothetical protein
MNDILASLFHIQHKDIKSKDNVTDIVWNNSSIKIDKSWFIFKHDMIETCFI